MAPIILILGAKGNESPLESVPAELNQINQLFKHAKLNLRTEYEPYLTKTIMGNTLRRVTDQVAILHFAGHSSSALLEMNDEPVYSKQIAGLIQTWASPPSLVFLNGCNSANQVKAFHEAGVKNVIATRKTIGDQNAARFSSEFYAELLNHPEKTTITQAFERSGITVFMSKPGTPRSLDINDVSGDNKEWDWGLYSSDMPAAHWTLNEITNIKNTLSSIRTNWLTISVVALISITTLIFFLINKPKSTSQELSDISAKQSTTNITITSDGNSQPTVATGNATVTINNNQTMPIETEKEAQE